MTADLVAFLRERLDDDARIAQAAAEETDPAWDDNGLYGETVTPAKGGGFVACGAWGGDVPWELRQHIARHDPARALAEVDAKRRMLDEYDQALAQSKELRGTQYSDQGAVRLLTALRFLKLLALPYDAHPEYRPEWALEA